MKIAAWNMAYWQNRSTHKEAWACVVNQIKPDFLLFQEGKPPKDLEHLIWHAIGQRRDWGSGIYSPIFNLVEERIKTDFTGALSIANTTVRGQPITLISLYGLMESGGPTQGYSIPNLHRMLSDLTGLFNDHIGGKRGKETSLLLAT